jgi:hypothetical protein
MGLKTGQYYLRSRPARDAIQFTLDVDQLDMGITKNLSKAEMDAARRLKKKRPIDAVSQPLQSLDLNKKRKTSEMTEATTTEKKTEQASSIAQPETSVTEAKVDKPWEQNKQEEEEDYRWNICENCQ